MCQLEIFRLAELAKPSSEVLRDESPASAASSSKPKTLRHLGIDVQEWGGTAFTWTDGDGKPVAGTTIWRLASPLENADREMRRVLRIVDPHGRDRNARRHLHRREQRIEAV